jgi:hypothetical protein
MPTPDASQFTTLKKYNAIDSRPDNGVKVITHLYQPVPSVRTPRDFLASFTNKFMSPLTVRPCNYPTGPTTPTVPPAAPTISNFIIFEFYGPTYLPGGTASASIRADVANATTASYVVYLASSPTTVVTGSQSSNGSGTNVVVGPTPQSITLDPLASSPNFGFLINSAIASANGPYIVTLTATGPGGSVSQSINVPISV